MSVFLLACFESPDTVACSNVDHPFARMHSEPLSFSPPTPVSQHWQAKLCHLPIESPLPIQPVIDAATPGQTPQDCQTRDWQSIDIDAATWEQLQRLATKLALDVESLAIGLWLLLLWRYRSQAERVACTYIGQPQGQQFPIQSQFTPTTSVQQLLQQVSRELHQDMAQAIAPTELVALAQQNDLTAAQIWSQVGVVVNSTEEYPSESATALESLGLLLEIQPQRSFLELRYRRHDVETALVNRLAQHYATLVAAALRDSEQPITQINYLTDAELTQLRQFCQGQPQPYPATQTIHAWFEDRVAQNPAAIAITDGTESIIYQELNARANQLAHYLRHVNVQPDQLVAVALDRSINLFVALLGVLKAGAGYVALDPAYAQARRAYTLNDAQPQIVLTQASLVSLIPETTAPIVQLDRDWPTIAKYSPNNPEPIATPSNIAYVIYTSGSTGNPKGVMIEHGGLVNHAAAISREFAIQPTDRMLQFSNVGFDIIVEELYPTLVSGATLVLRPESIASSTQEFWEFVEQYQITILDLPTAFWHELVSSLVLRDRALPRTVRLVCVGGEKASRTAYKQWCDRVPESVRWINTYGPTETTVSATWYEPRTAGYEPEMGEIPIGQALPNVEVYVLDAHQQVLPVGIPGELCIGGPGVARGYLHLPEKTAERFVPNRLWDQADARLYRTGDVVRFREDGMLEFIGRSDFQVKIRGFRVELGEIEATLERHPQVRQAVVLAKQRANQKVLVAYVLSQDDAMSRNQAKSEHSGIDTSVGDVQALGQWLQQHLPNYMIPSQFVALESFPLTPNGKVDRKALPEPAMTSRTHDEPPADELEALLVNLWEEILGVPVNVTDNFFELGGHSLLVVRLCDQIEQHLNQRVSPMALFRSPTVQLLARHIRQDVVDDDDHSSAVVIQAGAENYPPLFAIHVLGEGGRFFRPLAQHLGLSQPVYGLAAQMMDTQTAPPNRVEDLAAFYIREMQAVQPHGPYYILGMSYGGIIAYEMARQMEQMGLPVGLVGLLDTYGPDQTENVPSRDRLQAHWRSACEQGRRRYVKHKLRTGFQRRMEKLRCTYGRWQQQRGKQISYELQYKLIIAENVRAEGEYEPGTFGGRLSLFRATDEVFYSAAYLENGLGWRNLVSQLDIYDVPGCHMTMVEDPQAQALAVKMRQAMEQDRLIGAACG